MNKIYIDIRVWAWVCLSIGTERTLVCGGRTPRLGRMAANSERRPGRGEQKKLGRRN